jgi:hypothetical protein
MQDARRERKRRAAASGLRPPPGAAQRSWAHRSSTGGAATGGGGSASDPGLGFLGALGSRPGAPSPPPRRRGFLRGAARRQALAAGGPAAGDDLSHLPTQPVPILAPTPAPSRPCAACAYGRQPPSTYHPSTVRPRSTSTSTRRPSIFLPSAALYASFISVLCSYSMKA